MVGRGLVDKWASAGITGLDKASVGARIGRRL